MHGILGVFVLCFEIPGSKTEVAGRQSHRARPAAARASKEVVSLLTIWVLAVNAECGAPASVSVHRTYEAAVGWLRSGWDVEGSYRELDGGALLERLRLERDVIAAIEPCALA